MGLITSRESAGNEESDGTSSQMYKYPAKGGDYFANYFIMGGEKFEAPQPEAYLFGDNMDLNFLGNRPVPFPYPAPQSNDPTRPLKCLVNIRKESVRFVRAKNSIKNVFNVEFIFDADVRCAITIFYFSTEDMTPTGVMYHPKDEKLTSEVFYYKRGANQQFQQPDHVFNPSLFPEEDLLYNIEKDVIPVVIQCVALEGPDEGRQSLSTIAVIEHHDGAYFLKALKQKLFVDGLCYLLQEIYGIENKLSDINKEISEDDLDDGGLECVICMSDMRDTLILPCRHLCLCQACADSLRYQANNCPICRSPFRALLQIKALEKLTGSAIATNEMEDRIPVGFKHISLVGALNGPTVITRRCSERMNRSLRLKISLGSRDADDGGCDSKDEIASIPLGKLACHDTEDEDKSSSITDHLLHNKSLICSPNTIRHVNEVSNTEDEMPDEDSEAEKLSPLLEVGIGYETSNTSRIEKAVSDLNEETNKSNSSNSVSERSFKSSNKVEEVSEIPGVSSDIPIKCLAEDFTCGSSEEYSKTIANSNSLSANKEISSQPSTPASIGSIRSSDDSYSSSGSSRRLLSPHEKPALV